MSDNLSQTIPPVPPIPPTVPPEPPSIITPPLASDAPVPPPPPPPDNPPFAAPTNPPIVPPTGLPDASQPAPGSKKIKIGLAIAVLFLVGAALPAAIWLTGQKQEVRKEAVGEICCRVEARNLCDPGLGSWDMTVGSFATEAECDAYIATSSFSYSCNCCARCTATGGGSEDPAQICSDPACPSMTKKIRCSSSGSDLRKVIVNPAACVGPTATPPAATPTPPTTISCYQPCTRNVTVCATGLTCADSNEGAVLPYYLCLNATCPGNSTCACGPTGTPVPTNTPRPTNTPVLPGYTASCLNCRAYDANWNQITPASIQLGQTVYFATQGSTNHPQGITKARFRINGAAWQETTNKHGDLFYIQYTVAAAGSYTVESMVFNPILGWY